MTKLFWTCTAFYIFYAFLMWWYLFYGSPAQLPDALEGTAADPTTFMTSREIQLSYDYSRLKHLLFFLVTPFEWLVLLSIIVFGGSSWFYRTAEAVTNRPWLKNVLYVFLLSVTTFALMFPLKWLSHQISVNYGVSVADFSVWMKDVVIGYWLNLLILIVIASWFVWIMKKAPKRWWFYSWLASVPFILFLVFIQPVVIDPLYNDFRSLQDKQLEAKILNIAQQADIPAEHVYEVNMSKKTNALNAYVNGIGSNARIVLWDTTLQKLNDDEVIFIMAHEMAHYVYKHVFIGLSGYLLLSFFGFWFVAKGVAVIKRKWGEGLGVRKEHILLLPVILLLFSVLSFASSPLSNYVSREIERSADTYAIELTEDQQAAIKTFQQLTATGLSEVQPPTLVYWFRYGHPSMLERLQKVEQFETAEEK
ncbi:M48 family metallopeptidase [Bacillus tianshenii]|nr:M48 family metallopeptidase [Bacillus tianshenii]